MTEICVPPKRTPTSDRSWHWETHSIPTLAGTTVPMRFRISDRSGLAVDENGKTEPDYRQPWAYLDGHRPGYFA